MEVREPLSLTLNYDSEPLTLEREELPKFMKVAIQYCVV